MSIIMPLHNPIMAARKPLNSGNLLILYSLPNKMAAAASLATSSFTGLCRCISVKESFFVHRRPWERVELSGLCHGPNPAPSGCWPSVTQLFQCIGEKIQEALKRGRVCIRCAPWRLCRLSGTVHW